MVTTAQDAAHALAALQAGAPGEQRGRHASSLEERVAWEEAMLEALEATGHHDEAQKRRWADFEATLSIPRLRAYLKGLPDFDDVEEPGREPELAGDQDGAECDYEKPRTRTREENDTDRKEQQPDNDADDSSDRAPLLPPFLVVLLHEPRTRPAARSRSALGALVRICPPTSSVFVGPVLPSRVSDHGMTVPAGVTWMRPAWRANCSGSRMGPCLRNQRGAATSKRCIPKMG